MTKEEEFYRRFVEPRESATFISWWIEEGEKLPSHLPPDELFRLRIIAFLAYERGFKEGVNL